MSWQTDFDDESLDNIERDRRENHRPRAYPKAYDNLFDAIVRGEEGKLMERAQPNRKYTMIAITQAVRSMYYNAYGLTLDFYGS